MLSPSACESTEKPCFSTPAPVLRAANGALGLRPNAREFYAGLAVLTVLAGVTMMRGGQPQSGFAAGEVREPAVRDYRSLTAGDASVRSTTQTLREDGQVRARVE